MLFRVLETYIKEVENCNRIVDVGCGTGIATRKLYHFFGENNNIVGCEPNEDMLGCARKTNDSKKEQIDFVLSRAEKLPFENESVKCVLTAQAIQWFERDKFYREVERILVNSGCLAILQNNRNWQENSFLQEYEEILEKYNPDYNRGYRDIQFVNELEGSRLFHDVLYCEQRWNNKMTFNEFLGMSSSSTKADKIIKKEGFEKYKGIIADLMNSHCDEQKLVDVSYKTELYLFRKKDK